MHPNSAKTHCLRGHDLSGDNIRIQKRRNGKEFRQCKKCVKERTQEIRRNQRQQAEECGFSSGRAKIVCREMDRLLPGHGNLLRRMQAVMMVYREAKK